MLAKVAMEHIHEIETEHCPPNKDMTDFSQYLDLPTDESALRRTEHSVIRANPVTHRVVSRGLTC